MIELKSPATFSEVAKAMGVSRQAVNKRFVNEQWKCTERKSPGGHAKEFALKDLPAEITQAVITYRMKELQNEQSKANENTSATQSAECSGFNRATSGRNHGLGNPVNGFSVDVYGTGDEGARIGHAALGMPKNAGLGGNDRPADGVSANSPGKLRVKGNSANQRPGNKRLDETSQIAMRGVLAVDGSGAHGGDLEYRPDGGLSGVATRPVNTDEKQRNTDGARQYILNFVGTYPGSLKQACEFLTAGFAKGELSVDLQHAILNCNNKLNDSRLGVVSASTVDKWLQLRKKTGCCIPKKTRSKTDWQSVWWLPLFLACYRKPQKPSITEAHRAFVSLWAAQGFQEDCPSYWAIDRLLKPIPLLVKEWGRSTGSEYRSYQSFVRRDWSGMSSNEVWVGDGHSFKAKVRHPDKPTFAFAPEVTVIIDARSRFIVGWAFSLSENQIAVSESLGKGMLKYGKPLIYYSDNGPGQIAKTIDHPAGGMLARMGVRHETGIPGNPQGRGIIEGLWDITTIAVAKTMPTFQGTGMDDGTIRKNTAAINSAKTRNEIPDFVPTWEEFISACEAKFEWYNTQHKHSELGGKTPAEVYHANFDDSWALHLTDEEKATLYRPFVERMPSRGEVRFINNIYFSKKLEELPAKATVRVSYDLHDASVVWISDLQGVFICEAVWDGNKVDGFQKSFTQELKQQRIDGQKKRAMDKFNQADMSADVIDGEVLKRIEPIATEIVEPLKRVVVDGDFVQQEPAEKQLTWLETQQFLQGKKVVNE